MQIFVCIFSWDRKQQFVGQNFCFCRKISYIATIYYLYRIHTETKKKPYKR
jgi:hypothetical protein